MNTVIYCIKNFQPLMDFVVSCVTIIGLIFVILAAWFAKDQLKEMTRARKLDGMLKVYEMIGSKDARDKRHYIYFKLKSSPEKLKKKEIEIVQDVSVTLDRIGQLVASGLIPREELFHSHSEMFIRTWKHLEPFVMHFRKTINGDYVNNFETLARQAETYFHEHNPGKKISTIEVW